MRAAGSRPQGAGLAAFVVATFGWTWIWWALSAWLTSRGVLAGGASLAVSTLGDLGPLVMAWWFVARERGVARAWRFLGECVRPGGRRRLWLVGTMAVLLVLAVARAAQWAWAGATLVAPSIWLVMPQLVLMLALGGGQEEFGWRGWLQPRLVQAWGRWRGVLALGVIWFCWHLPLWWVPGSAQQSIPMLAFAGFTVGFSMLVWRIQQGVGGRPAVAIWLHAVNNTAAVWLPFAGLTGGWQPGVIALAVGYPLVGLVAMVLPVSQSSSLSSATESSTREGR